MKKYLIFVFFILLIVSYTNVNASSINYNVIVDKDFQLYETITYNIDKKDVKNDGYYHFLTSIVNDNVYFDLKEEIKYNKTKQTTSNGYLVTLKYDYASLFLSKSRIINECFVKKQIQNNTDYVSFQASDFYCAHRADNIRVSIVTDLDVVKSNATSHNGNAYVWDNIDDKFNINIKIKQPNLEITPMDDIHSDINNNDNDNGIDSDNSEENDNNENNRISTSIILITGAVLVFSIIGVSIALKRKKGVLICL